MYFISGMCVLCLNTCVCPIYMLGACRARRGYLNPLELELCMDVSCYVGAGN